MKDQIRRTLDYAWKLLSTHRNNPDNREALVETLEALVGEAEARIRSTYDR